MDQSLAEFLRYLSLEKNASPLTVKSYREDLTQAIAFFRGRLGPDATPADLRPRMLRAFLASLAERDYARATVARRMAGVRSWLRFQCRRGTLVGNPSEGIRAPRLNRTLPHFLTAEQVQ